MKYQNALLEKIYDYDNLLNAYYTARRGKRFREDVLKYSQKYEENLIILQNELIWKSYKTGTYNHFYVYDPKFRHIMSLPFRDRVFQHALHNILEPVFDRQFIYDSYACRTGKGTHTALNRCRYFMKKPKNRYCLKIDIRKYFDSIDHLILKQIIKKTVGDDTIWLIDDIIDSNDDIVGIPIGNLTSQLFANIYLNELDQYIKHEIKARYYIRYMDDMLIFGDKGWLNSILIDIKHYVNLHLKITSNDKTGICPIDSGVEFLGYINHRTYRKIKSQKRKRLMRYICKLNREYESGNIDNIKYQQSIQSIVSHLDQGSDYGFKYRLLKMSFNLAENVI